MKNGKRIEFKGAAKIVILAIAILATTGITVIGAATFSCPECPESGLEFSAVESWERKNELYCPYNYDVFYHGAITDSYRGKIYVYEYNSLNKATSDFEAIRRYDNPNREETILSNSGIKFVFICHDRTSPDIEIHGHFLDIEKKVRTKVIMEVDIYGLVSDSDIAEAKKRFQALAKCAHNMTGWKDTEEKEEYTLTLKQYPPYYEPRKDDPRRAGDLVATLIDKNGKGVSDKTVFFYVEPGTNLKGVLESALRPTNDWVRIRQNFPKLSYIGCDYTSKKGVAILNYIDSGCIRLDVLSKRIKDAGKSIKGPITAVVYDEKTDEIGQKASVNIELSGVARITKIISLSGDEAMIRVTKKDEGTKDVYDKDDIPKDGLPIGARCTPYDLLYNDVILVDKNDYIRVHWVTGTKMSAQPKEGFLKKDQPAKIHIGKIDASLARKMGSYTCLGIFLEESGFVVGLYANIAGEIVDIPAVTMIGFNLAEDKWQPLLIQLFSTILIDLDETATVYTVEGTGILHNIKDNSTTNVTTGHKISVLPDGTFSQISEFDRSELSEELSYLLDEIEGKPHKPAPVTPSVGLIHNIDSGEDFLTIQDAVDDSDTKNGDTITVDPGIYVENVLVYKELTIQSVEGMNSTTVHGNGTHAFNVTTNRVKISGFSIGSGDHCGIRVADADDCIISNNTVSGSHQGIYMLNSNRNMISGNTVWFNDMCGIILSKSSYNEIRNNNVNFNDMRGIGIWHGNENRITDNVMEENTRQAIYLYNTSKNKINDNIVSGCPNRSGIELSHSNDNEIRNNTANANNHHGIGLWTSNENIIANNTVKDNRLNGIYVQESEHNVITYNDVSDSVFWHGIYLDLSDNNEIENNVVSSNNMHGVKFEDSDENTLADNAIKGNGGFGIYLNNASINNVYLNDVFDNTKGTADFINANTIWSSTSEIDYTYNGKSYTSKMGNHWIDYTGTDANGDGIGDVPYVIGGIDSDDYVLMSSREEYFGGTVQPTPEPTIFDTGEGGYPSVAGTHKGKITPSSDIMLNGVYAYPCEGTNGHIKSIKIYEKDRLILDESISKGKLQTRREQWWKFKDQRSDGLKAGVEYYYIIETSSYPQMIHTQVHNADGGSITCDEFVDVNGKVYNDWIPAFKLE